MGANALITASCAPAASQENEEIQVTTDSMELV